MPSLVFAALSNLRTGWLRLANSVRTWFVVNLLLLAVLLYVDFATAAPEKTKTWWPDFFAVATNLLAGGLVSFLFYYLVVHLPEARKKSFIKTNLQYLYLRIKKDILQAVVHASMKGGRADLSSDYETIEKLMTPAGFKAAFEDGREANEGFYAFENQMDDDTPLPLPREDAGGEVNEVPRPRETSVPERIRHQDRVLALR
jgi:hypothetical protein